MNTGVDPGVKNQRMYRLICTALTGILLLAALGCGAGRTVPAPAPTSDVAQGEDTQTGGAQWITEIENARLVSAMPVPAEVARLLRPLDPPSVHDLPPLPAPGLTTHAASVTIQHERLGSAAYDHSANAVPSGNSLVLSAPANGVSWGIWEFDGLSGINGLELLHIEASNTDFSAEDEDKGYWVGWADFDGDRWEIKSLTQHINYQRSIGATAQYLSAGDSFFCFALVADGQSVTIDRVALDVDSGEWTEVAVDTTGNRGWTPAIAFTGTGNPAVAYADLDAGKARWRIADRGTDLTIPSNWLLSTISSNPDGTARWLDAAIDPVYKYPRVSMVYEDVSGGSWNSTIGFSLVAEITTGSPQWLSYVVGDIDGAEYTSIDRQPSSGYYGIASMARNANRADQANDDMHYRLFQLEDPNIPGDFTVTLKRGFQEIFPDPFPDPFSFRNPHIRYSPADGSAAVVANGGWLLNEVTADEWSNPYSDAASGDFGSLAFNPVNQYFGQTFSVTEANSSELNFLEFSLSVPGSPRVVDSLNGAGVQVGAVSQVAYMSDGTPGIAYTVFDGSTTRVLYAFLEGADWTVEPVSSDAMDNLGGAAVHVDLAYDNTDTAGICYNHVDGSTCELRVALRGL